MATLRSLFTLVALLSVKVLADCVSYGVDFANGGSYYIDASSNQYFTFQTVFQGCNQDSISPVLVGPDGNEYACSAISTLPAGQAVTSTCGIPFSAMRSGSWKIIMQGQQVQVQRTITLTVGLPATTTVTATPTIVLGITSTPRAITVYSTRQQTATLILIPNTVTAGCNGAPVTVTNYQGGATVMVTSTIVRSTQGAAKTSYYTTTVAASAACHYPSSVSNPTSTNGNTIYITVPNGSPLPTSPSTTFCIGNSCFKQDKRSEESDAVEPAEKRDLQERAADAVAAQTVTYTETTYTVTQTLVTSIPARTTTELVLQTITATVQPPASTVCQNGSPPGQTVTVRPAASTITQTNLVYITSSAANIVWVGQTQYSTFSDPAQATACWRAGGWYGA